MGERETRMGGSREAFPETAWSAIVDDPAGTSPRRREAMTRLCTAYWRPIYRTLRVSWGKSIEDAKDLAQEFFQRLLNDAGFMERYDPGRGRFRHFIKGALQRFMAQVLRDGTTLKRGGGAPVIAIDAAAGEAGALQLTGAGRTPDEVFDRQWAGELLALAIERLRRELEAEGRGDHYRAYEAFDMAAGDVPTYEEISAQLKLPLQQVKNAIELGRSRLRRILMDLIADGVRSREEVVEEFRELFAE